MMRAEGVRAAGLGDSDLGASALPSGTPGGGGIPSDVAFFRLLGASQVSALDVSAYEEADVVHDLNRPVPDGLVERFDVVVDSGTLEHVFNVPQALANISRMLRPGGVVFHFNPASNYIDHGYYQLSPSLLLDYYTANGFTRCQAWLAEHSRVFRDRAWSLYAYEPGRSVAPFGVIRSTNSWMIFARAEKTAGSTHAAVPMQRWAGGAGGEGRGTEGRAWAKYARRVESTLRRSPVVWRVVGEVSLSALGLVRRRPVNARRVATLR